MSLKTKGSIAGIPKRYLDVGSELLIKPTILRYHYVDHKEEKHITISEAKQSKWIKDLLEGNFEDQVFRCIISSYKVDEKAKESGFQIAFNLLLKSKKIGKKVKVFNSAELPTDLKILNKELAYCFIYNVYDNMTNYRVQNIRDFIERCHIPVFLIYGGINPIMFYSDILGVKMDSVLYYKDKTIIKSL